MSEHYDALLLVAYGGPEKSEEVIPFLENALRGRDMPRERLEQVAHHYHLFGGASPINAQCRALRDAIAKEIDLPVYWGNRNWHPFLADALRQMRDDGIKRALALFTSPYSSYSSCRQYQENIAAAQAQVGTDAPKVERLRAYYNHPGFIEATIARLRDALGRLPGARVVFTAHSIPIVMAENCNYVHQLREACRLTAEGLDIGEWDLVWQSRSGSPRQPWLAPDIGDHLRDLHARLGVREVVVMPIGFISDHMEVVYDLDTEAARIAREVGITFLRAATIGIHPRFVAMIRELVEERTKGEPRLALGTQGPGWDVCPIDCCPPPATAKRL